MMSNICQAVEGKENSRQRDQGLKGPEFSTFREGGSIQIENQ